MKDLGLRIIVLGYIVRGPLGGLTWHHLQYLLGLQRLGHDVWFFEDSDDYPSCYDPEKHEVGVDAAYGLRYAARVFDATGMADRWAYFDAHTQQWSGPAGGRAGHLGQTADVVLNLSCVNPLRPWWEHVPVRVLVDTDPVFTQVRHLRDSGSDALAGSHTAFFTFGERFRQPGCTIPDDGLPWRPTRQPVVLDMWPVIPPTRDGVFTTVMQWESYPPVTWDGKSFGTKSASFRSFLDLPKRTSATLELAVGGVGAPRTDLIERGWRIQDPLVISRTPWSFQRYLSQSAAEFAVAKQAYVATASGWFSERSAGYLASGRPVLVQDTGFGEVIPYGEGLLSFSESDGAAAGIEEILRRHGWHCQQARLLAEEHFDARKVLEDLLARACFSG